MNYGFGFFCYGIYLQFLKYIFITKKVTIFLIWNKKWYKI
jgi:hypothetical protein